MGKPVNSNVKRVETTAINTKINKEILDSFRDCCSYLGYPMNVMLETFMHQYAKDGFNLSYEEVIEYKNDNSELDTLSTTFSKEIYTDFKAACKNNGYFVKHVLTAFMKKYIEKDYVLKYVDTADIKNNK